MASLPPRQTYQTKRSHALSFIHIPRRDPSLSTLLFLHGFPSQLHDWTKQIDLFSKRGFGVVALDLLGFGGSSKPSDVSEYRFQPMSDDLVGLLDHLELNGDSVVGIGHDLGAMLLSRMATYHPRRLSKLIFVSVGPARMGSPFNVQGINEMTKKILGHELLGYIPWIAGEDTGAQQELEAHAESAMSLMFCADHTQWDEWFRPMGKMRQFVGEGRRVAIGSWYSDELRKHHLNAYAHEDGYKGVVYWYRMMMGNLFMQDEVGYEEFVLDQPTLLITDTGPGGEQQQSFLGAWVKKVKTVKIDGGHWLHLERADETNEAVLDFLTS